MRKDTFHENVASLKFWALLWQTIISSKRITKQMKYGERLLYCCSQVLVFQMERFFRRLKDFSVPVFMIFCPLNNVLYIAMLCGK